MKKDLIGVFIFFGICCFVNAEICSIYRELPISMYSDRSWISGPRRYYVEEECAISLSIELHFECNSVLFDVENITSVAGVELRNIRTNKIYSSDTYSFYDNGILNISFPENIPPGLYHLHFNCNVKNSSPFISEWFVLSNFDDNNLEKTNSESVRIWFRKSALGHGKYLLENAQNLLRAFKEFTGTAYNENKFVKLDLFVMPKSSTSKDDRGDFIYVDEEVFVNEENIATENNEKLYLSLTESILDQAFENYNLRKLSEHGINIKLLKEYLIYYIADKAIKNWHFEHQFVESQRASIFGNEFVLNRQAAIKEGNSFRAGTFRVRMIHHTLGDDNFKNFLRGRDVIENTDNSQIVKEALESWNLFYKHAIVIIERDYEANKASITQQAFKKDINATEKVLYWIPLNFASEDNPDFNDTTVTHWLDPRAKAIKIVTPPKDKWLICNKQQFGYYRVNYDENNWKLIINYLNSENYKTIHVLNRAQLLDDAFVFAEFGYLNYSIAFDLARYLKYETEYLPWTTFWEKMERLFHYSSISSTRYYEPFKNMILELSGPLERKFLSNETSDPNDRMERLNRKSFIKWTCFYGSTLGCNYSLQKLKNWLDNPLKNPVSEDFQEEIMCSGIRTADRETWYKLLDKYQSNKEQMILDALICTSKYELLEELIKMFIKGQLIRQHPWAFLIEIAQHNPTGLDAIIRFIYNNQTALRHMYKHDLYYPVEMSIEFFEELSKEECEFGDLIIQFCTVIEQFATNDQQLNKLNQILNISFNILGQQIINEHFHYTELKVRDAVSVFNAMKNYWNAQ